MRIAIDLSETDISDSDALDALFDAITRGFYLETEYDSLPPGTALVSIHSVHNAAYEDELGEDILILDFRRALREALRSGEFAIIRDENGNTVGSVNIVGDR